MTADVRKPSPAVEAMQADWALIDALMGGTDTMRRAGRRYLPQWPAESDKAYDTRLATATLFPALARTVSVLTGKPFSKPLTLGDDVPPRIAEWCENIDRQRRNLHTFAADLTMDAMARGFCGILVDCPPAGGVLTVAQERAAGIRPYMIHIRPGQVLGWRTAMGAEGMVLTQLRLLECVEEDDGPFGTATIEQVRVLEPGRWTVWRKAETRGVETWTIFDEGVTTLPVVPFVPVYGFYQAFMVGKPPLMDLAHANVEHWQSKSDQQTILHVARVPLLFTKDIGDAEITVGAGTFINATSPNADVRYVEHSGAAIEAGRLSILDLEDRMRQAGAELLVIKPGNTTTVQTIADNEQGMCDLQRIMQGVENAIDNALGLMARWVGEPEGGHVSIYRDFGAATLAEASATLLFQTWQGGGISHPTLLAEYKRRGILSPDIEIEDEVEAAAGLDPEADADDQTPEGEDDPAPKPEPRRGRKAAQPEADAS